MPDPYNPISLDRYAYSRNNPVNYTDPSGHWPEWWDWLQGAVYQYANDMTGGAVEDITLYYGVCMDCNVSDAYRQGQQAGRDASIVVASVDQVTGAAIAAAGAAAIVPTAGGGAACAIATGGLCALPAGAAILVEGGMVVAGTGTAVYGTGVIAFAKNNPVKSSGNSPQFKRLSSGEIKMLENAGYDVHELKGGKSASKYDLFKDGEGNIFVKPKNGNGPGDETGLNINNLEK